LGEKGLLALEQVLAELCTRAPTAAL
jgi:hypothetical protein